MSTRWAVAAPHTSASAAAADVFERGGNAVDAALAAAVTLTVVYPNQCSVGGDVIALVGTPDGAVHSVDGSGRAPNALTPALLGPSATTMPVYGPFAVTVPGAVSAWHHLAERWGSAPLASTLLRASELAADGVAVAPGLARDLEREQSRLRYDEGLRETFVRDGAILAEGAVLRQPRLARTLAELAEGGADALYTGAIGASLVRTLRQLGSPITETDFAEHRTSFGQPISTTYSDVDYLTAPPGSQGAFFLEGLAALELVRQALGRELDPLGEDAVTVARALGAAARDRDALLGDPAVATVDVEGLLSHRATEIAHAALAGRMPTAVANALPFQHKASGDTVAIVAADSDGTWISLIQSNFHAFGSGILDPGSGVVLHNRGASFSLRPDSPNLLAGGRRPAHTLMPVLVRKSEELVGAHGTMGGRAQPQIHTQIALHLAGGCAPETAVSRPRWVLGSMEAGGGDASALDVIKVEQDVPSIAQQGLQASGFELSMLPSGDDGAGHAQLVRTSTNGGLVAATDPRADGAARTS